jgi:hypothetical protein
LFYPRQNWAFQNSYPKLDANELSLQGVGAIRNSYMLTLHQRLSRYSQYGMKSAPSEPKKSQMVRMRV